VQQRQQQVGQLQCGGDVDADQAGDGILVLLFEQAELVDPGGIDHAVEAAETPRGIEHRMPAAALGEVGADQADLPRIATRQRFQGKTVASHQ